MTLEAPSGNDLPWMVRANENEWIDFDIKMSTVEKSENERGWSCYIGHMKDIQMPGVEDGDYEIPFWAMEEFYAAYTESPEKKGWVQLGFKRTKRNGKNMGFFRV